MIELGATRSRLLKKVLPFAVALGIGVLSAGVSRHPGPRGNQPQGHALSTPVAHGRSWLLIHERPVTPYLGQCLAAGDSGVKLLVRFNTDGSVSVLTPDVDTVYGPDDLLRDAASDAAGRIRFTPPAEDGKPLAVVAVVDYGAGRVCADGYDKHGRSFGGCHSVPSVPSVSIISVEGAQESEGWRVIYE